MVRTSKQLQTTGPPFAYISSLRVFWTSWRNFSPHRHRNKNYASLFWVRAMPAKYHFEELSVSVNAVVSLSLIDNHTENAGVRGHQLHHADTGFQCQERSVRWTEIKCLGSRSVEISNRSYFSKRIYSLQVDKRQSNSIGTITTRILTFWLAESSRSLSSPNVL